MTSNTITVLTTIEGANIGDDVVATSRRAPDLVIRGRLADAGGVVLLLETSDGHRSAFLHDEWSFTAEPTAPVAFVGPQVECPGCPACTEAARYRLNQSVAAGDQTATTSEESQHGQMEAEIGRLTALVANKQAVIDEDRADAKRNRDLMSSEIADLKHALAALEIDQRNDANQRADELAARVQELEVEAARFENALEKADALIQALRHRYGTHVALGEAEKDDGRAARSIRDADEQNRDARRALAEVAAGPTAAPAEVKPCSCGHRNAFATTPRQRIVHRADGPCFIEHVVDAASKFDQ